MWVLLLAATLAVAALAGVVIALVVERSNHNATPPVTTNKPPAQQAGISRRVAGIVTPLVAPQQLVTSRLTALQGTAASFASLRSAAVALDQAALRAQGAAATLSPTGASGARAKSALTTALSLQAAYASALTRLPNPAGMTSALADRIATQAGNVDGAFNRNLLDATGNPCCTAMPVSQTSAQGLIAIAAQAETAPPPPPKVTTQANVRFQTFSGSIFNIEYPANWQIDDAEQQKPGFVDTTIRDPASSTLTYLRVDYTPNTQGTVKAAALGQEQAYARGVTGYREIGFSPTTFAGYPAYLWEFIAPQDGVLVHKTDLFLIDGDRTGIAILMQAPVSSYASWQPIFNQMYQSFALN